MGARWGFRALQRVLILCLFVLLCSLQPSNGDETGNGEGDKALDQNVAMTRCASPYEVRNEAGECAPATGNYRNSTLITILMVGCVCVIVMFILRYLYMYRMHQLQLREMGQSGIMYRRDVEFVRIRKPKHKQLLAEDLLRITGGGEGGTLWINVKTKNQEAEAEKMVPIHWKHLGPDQDQPNPGLVDFGGPLFGIGAEDMAISIDRAESFETNAPDTSLGKRAGSQVQELGEACCICLENKSDTRLLPCGHATSCRKCLFSTLCTWNRAYGPNCPLCRATVSCITLHGHSSGPVAPDSVHAAAASQPNLPATEHAPQRPVSERPVAYSMVLPTAQGQVRQAQAPRAAEASLAADLCFTTDAPSAGAPQEVPQSDAPVVASVALTTLSPGASGAVVM